MKGQVFNAWMVSLKEKVWDKGEIRSLSVRKRKGRRNCGCLVAQVPLASPGRWGHEPCKLLQVLLCSLNKQS